MAHVSNHAHAANPKLLKKVGGAAAIEKLWGDLDLLVLTHHREGALGVATPTSGLLNKEENWSDPMACEQPFSAVVSDAEASDLDPDFLGEVAREGVLLYLQDGARVPEALAGLRPYEEWLRAVEAELAECRAVLALPPVERQVAPGV